MRNYNENKINYKDYGFATPAEMAIAAWVAEEPINLSVNGTSNTRYVVTSFDAGNQTMVLVDDVTKESQEVAYSDIMYAYRVL